jgi:hypothetical protein
VPVVVAVHTTGELVVDERTAIERQADWFSPMAEGAVKAFLADTTIDRAVASQLRPAWAIHDEIIDKMGERQKAAQEQYDLSRESEETRGNLRAIEKNKAADPLRAKLTRRLDEISTRVDVLARQLADLDAILAGLHVQFREAVREVQWVRPISGPG